MQLILVPIFLTVSFALAALYFAIRSDRNRLLWSLVGAWLGVAVLFPFRTYRIPPLDASLRDYLSNEAVLSTKEIVIPGFPQAYNPSLLPFKEGYLLSFRVRYYNASTFLQKICSVRTSFLGLVPLDRQFKVCGQPHLLQIRSYEDRVSSSMQDGRLFQMGDKILLFFNDYGATRHRSSFAQYVVELVEQQGKLQPKERAKQLRYPNMTSIEKNWIPFVAQGQLYLIYSTEPHLILEPDLTTGLCQSVADTTADTPWKWGIIRGGTPAQQIEEGLLTFFHSSQELPAASFFGTKVGRNYAMGAYLFEPSYPFTIRKMTPQPIGSVEDYTKNNRRKVVFPSGVAVDGNHIHVVWGKNDTGIAVSTLDKRKLLAGMTLCSGN